MASETCNITGCSRGGTCQAKNGGWYCQTHWLMLNGESMNLTRGMEIVNEIQSLRGIQRALKDAFAHRELDGGPKAAFDHPLYLQSDRRIADLEEELVGLI